MSDALFQWDPTKYSVKVDLMDNEHKQLIGYMNVLFQKHSEKASKEELRKALKQFGEYTVKHFKDEEEFFSKIPNYPLKDAHKRIHSDLLGKFKIHADNFEKTGTFSDEFFLFLKVWLTSHIAGVDMKYGELASQKAA